MKLRLSPDVARLNGLPATVQADAPTAAPKERRKRGQGTGSRTAALESLKSRLSDDEITSIVGAIVQGEQLGTPLAILFRTQADFMRIKRTQRAETIAGEAGVKMLMPTVLIMAATVLIILGPFILSLMTGDFLG